MKHVLKVKKQFIAPIVNGYKNFEIRFNDRGFQKDDLVQFVHCEEDIIDGPFADWVRELETNRYVITYVLSGWGLKNGFVVFGFTRFIRPGETF